VVYRQGWWQTTINVTKTVLKASTGFTVWLNSTPVNLGTFTSDTAGNLSINANIPADTPTGFHTVHIYGQNASGEDIDIYRTIYVADSEIDFGGDGVTNTTDPCTTTDPSAIDYDKDGVDDACDPLIDQPPLIVEPPAEDKSPLETTVLTGTSTPIQIATTNITQTSMPTIFAANNPQVLSNSTQIQQPTPQSQSHFSDFATANTKPVTQKNKNNFFWLVIIGVFLISLPSVIYFFKTKRHQ